MAALVKLRDGEIRASREADAEQLAAVMSEPGLMGFSYSSSLGGYFDKADAVEIVEINQAEYEALDRGETIEPQGKKWVRPQGGNLRMTTDLTPHPDGYPIKLVRDGTPDLINETGEPGHLFYGDLPPGEDPSVWLRRKLAEEVSEYLIDPGEKELIDVLAVVKALGEQIHDISLARLITKERAHPRGGFGKLVMMYGRHPEFDKAA